MIFKAFVWLQLTFDVGRECIMIFMKTFEMAKATCKKLSGDLILENYFCNSKKIFHFPKSPKN